MKTDFDVKYDAAKIQCSSMRRVVLIGSYFAGKWRGIWGEKKLPPADGELYTRYRLHEIWWTYL